MIRHTRIDRVLASFERQVWSRRFRRAPCHAHRCSWAVDPVAVSDRLVFGKGRLWRHKLTLLGAPALVASERIHVDGQGRPRRDRKAALGKAELGAEVDVDSRRLAGYGGRTAGLE